MAALAIALAIGAGAVAVAAPTSTLAIACNESGEAGRLYTVTLCITSPDDGATLTGTAPVAATVTVNGTSPGVRGSSSSAASTCSPTTRRRTS